MSSRLRLIGTALLELTFLRVAHDVGLLSRNLGASNSRLIEQGGGTVPRLWIWSHYNAELIFPGSVLAEGQGHKFSVEANQLLGAERAQIIDIYLESIWRIARSNGQSL